MGGTSDRVVLGRIGKPFGVRGWLRLVSWTERRAGIFDYARWQLGRDGHWQGYSLRHWRGLGPELLALLEGVGDRDQARALQGCLISVGRSELPALSPGECYWHDLIGLPVVNRRGEKLGVVAKLARSPAQDVLDVRGRRHYMIPFVQGEFVLAVEAERILVDWLADWCD